MKSRMVWEHVKESSVIQPFRGCIIFDDSILYKNHSHRIQLVRHQYSAAATRMACDQGHYWHDQLRARQP